jgi:cell division protein FtsB
MRARFFLIPSFSFNPADMQILVAALIAVLTVMQYLLWVDEDGVRQTYALRISVQAQTEENAALNERNRALEADIKDLKTGLMAIEERARSEMGMIRQDETFYRLLEEPPSKSIAPDNPAPPPAVKPVAPPAKPANTAEAAPPTKPTAAKPPATTEKPATAAAKPGPSFKPSGQ